MSLMLTLATHQAKATPCKATSDKRFWPVPWGSNVVTEAVGMILLPIFTFQAYFVLSSLKIVAHYHNVTLPDFSNNWALLLTTAGTCGHLKKTFRWATAAFCGTIETLRHS